MRRWNWWLAYQVLRGFIYSVSYEQRDGRRITVELEGSAKAVHGLRPR